MVLLGHGGAVVLTPRRTQVTRGLAALLALGSLAVAGVASADDPAPTLPTAPDAVQPPPVEAIQPDQAETLRVLRRAPRPTDALPADALAAAGPERFGRNPDLARAVRTTTGTGWVVPGDGVICLVAPDPVDGYGTTCSPTAVVATNGLTLGEAGPDAASATTVVPDGAKVVIESDEGRRSSVTPDNTGVTRVDATDADHLDIVTAEGTSSVPLSDADDIAASAPR